MAIDKWSHLSSRRNKGRIIKHNQYLWWALKREIWDFGYQSCYDSHGKFLNLLRKLFQASIQIKKQTSLLQEWQDVNPKREEISYSNFQAAYTLLILEEIIERARFAAMRTVNWDNQLKFFDLFRHIARRKTTHPDITYGASKS